MPDQSPSYKLHHLVTLLDRAADRILKSELDISYKRALFLIVLHTEGPMTQHALAQGLGYSDAAVSLMLKELEKNSLVSSEVHPQHGKKNLIRLSADGTRQAEATSHLLNERFEVLVRVAGIDISAYEEATERLLDVLKADRSKK